jgi:hypothetical protein
MGRPGPSAFLFAADKVQIADAIEFLVVGHSGLTIAEADFRSQTELDINPAIGCFALKGPPSSPLVGGKRPRAFGPDRLVARRYATRILIAGRSMTVRQVFYQAT